MTDTTADRFVPNAASRSESTATRLPARPVHTGWSMFFGVFLPTLVLVLEAATGFCASTFFDPIPTFWHIALVGCVPAVTFFACYALLGRKVKKPLGFGLMCGFALSVAAYYALLYVPLVPASVVALVLMGMGLLSLAPALSLLALASLMWRLWQRQDLGARTGRYFFGGILLGVLAIAIVDGPRYLTRYALHMATSANLETQESGLDLLRSVGSEKTVLQACYESRRGMSGATDPAAWVGGFVLRRPDPTEVRRIYYRMTGVSFSSVAAPKTAADFLQSRRGLTFSDSDRGGAEVGGRVPGLSLGSSRIDSHLDPVSSQSYTEWTLEFENDEAIAAEARFGVALPPGSAVSRLTLWIHGEPHEAAFGTKAQTRGAYESVVRRQLDPVLVTQNGPDRVLVQCFPVPGNGQMKIRIGITGPLDPLGRSWLPSIIEQNFEIASGLSHDLWAQTKGKDLRSGLAELTVAKPRGGGTGLRGSIPGEFLSGGQAWLAVGQEDSAEMVHALDRLGDPDSPRLLVRRSEKVDRSAADTVVVVLDRSQGMSRFWDEIIESLHSLASERAVTLVLAGDSIEEAEGADKIAALLHVSRPAGGIDNSPALLRGLEIAGKSEAAPLILWLHGPQPELLTEKSLIEQSLERQHAPRTIYSLQLGEGGDRVSETFAAHADLRPAPRGEHLAERIGLLTEGKGIRHDYEILPAGDSAPEGSVEVWDHLVRGWALDEVSSAILGSSGDERSQLAQRAARYQLVTPVSGAVVLEQKSQFEAAGLDQLSANATPSVPVIPEPSTGLLALFGGALLALRRRRKG